MAPPLEASISALYRYPMKGLNGEALSTVTVDPKSCFPYDRAYAIENGPIPFNPKAPKPLPKINFLMLMRDERLALLESKFDEETKTLTIMRKGRQVAKGCLSTNIGRNMLEQFFAAFMSKELKGAPRILHAQNHHFTDKPGRYVHIINENSVKALSQLANEEIDPLRFRANIHLSGLEPWSEKKWQDKNLIINDVEIKIIEETIRCAAINVDPKTAKRGKSLPSILSQHFGQGNFGVYGEIIKGGTIAQQDKVSIVDRN